MRLVEDAAVLLRDIPEAEFEVDVLFEGDGVRLSGCLDVKVEVDEDEFEFRVGFRLG